MALKEMDQFNSIVDKIKDLVNWYENCKLEEITVKVFLTSGNSFNYRIPRDKVAHLLGVKTESLILTGMFKNTQSYEVLKELFRNQTRISGMIKDGVIKLNDIFSKHINEKLSGFKNNCSINIFNNMFVCKYNREKVIQQGKNPRNCNYIICSSLDDGTILELDLIINNKYALPVSNRLFNDEIEAQESFKELLQDQDISFISSIIIYNNYFDNDKKIYLKEEDKIFKLQVLKNYKLQYNCNIDVVGDCEYGYKRTRANKMQGQNDYDIYDYIISCLMDNKLISTEKLGTLTNQNIELINAINDKIMYSSDSTANQETYSNLQNQVSKLKETNKILQTQNTELNNSLKQTQDDLNNVNQEYQKTLTFINTVKDAFNSYNEDTEYHK